MATRNCHLTFAKHSQWQLSASAVQSLSETHLLIDGITDLLVNCGALLLVLLHVLGLALLLVDSVALLLVDGGTLLFLEREDKYAECRMLQRTHLDCVALLLLNCVANLNIENNSLFEKTKLWRYSAKF